MRQTRPTISQLMNRDILTTRTDAQLAPVVELMIRRGLGEISVVDHDHALLGQVRREALLEGAVAGDSPEEFLGHTQRKASVTCELDHGFRLDIDSSATVADVMSRRVIAVRPDTTLREAAALMTEYRLAVLPVVSALGVLLGTLSAVDLVGQLQRRGYRS
jgi:CBS domain-containing protein